MFFFVLKIKKLNLNIRKFLKIKNNKKYQCRDYPQNISKLVRQKACDEVIKQRKRTHTELLRIFF